MPRPQARGHVAKEGKALRAEPLGRVLTAFLTSFFPRYVDNGFTADMEGLLDDVSGLTRYFFSPFVLPSAFLGIPGSLPTWKAS